MSTRILTVIGILSLTALVSCGPKDIGQGSSGDDEYADSGAPDPREEMRYPFNAASRPQERVLYNINRPSVMEHIQNYNHSLVAPRGEEENSRRSVRPRPGLFPWPASPQPPRTSIPSSAARRNFFWPCTGASRIPCPLCPFFP